ncbi:unnamed protein product [Natator depressus]
MLNAPRSDPGRWKPCELFAVRTGCSPEGDCPRVLTGFMGSSSRASPGHSVTDGLPLLGERSPTNPHTHTHTHTHWPKETESQSWSRIGCQGGCDPNPRDSWALDPNFAPAACKRVSCPPPAAGGETLPEWIESPGLSTHAHCKDEIQSVASLQQAFIGHCLLALQGTTGIVAACQ